MRIGLHVSMAGSLEKAVAQAHDWGADTLQIFSSNPRTWRAARPEADDIGRMQQLRAQYDIAPLVIHDNYLINLAAADLQVRRQSIVAFRGEVERAVAIGAEYLVAHPGSYRNQTVESAMTVFAESLGKAAERLRSDGLTLLLECTAGQGCALGSRLEELAELRRLSAGMTGLRIGFCLDTCHLLASGYDVAASEGLDETLRRADELLGMANIPVIHANDSKHPLGSHKDRHQQIGKGFIGEAGFARILRHPMLTDKAFVLETPAEEEGDELRNLQALRRLSGLVSS